jgi:FkbM family methyltransferase
MRSDLIYDVGAHKGEDAEFYLLKGFRVVAIEAVPTLCDEIRVRLRSYLKSGQLTLINAAIADTVGPITFFVNQKISVYGTAWENWAKRNELFGAPSNKTTVNGIRFSDVLAHHGIPYYLKIDIEGSDLLCLNALKLFRSLPKYVSIESATVRWTDALEEFSLFRELGYSKFKLVQQRDVPKQRCPNPPAEGKYVDHQFEKGSSGLFGEEVPGKWMSEREAINSYRVKFLRYRLVGDESILWRSKYGQYFYNRYATRLLRVGWYDTHATI